MNSPTKEKKKQLKSQFKKAEAEKNRLLIGLNQAQMESLLAFLDRELEIKSCDHSFRYMIQWATECRLDPEDLGRRLEQWGAFCDCEITYNLDPDGFFRQEEQGSSWRYAATIFSPLRHQDTKFVFFVSLCLCG